MPLSDYNLLSFHLSIITLQLAASNSHKAVPAIDALRLVLCPRLKLINDAWFYDEGSAHRHIIRLLLRDDILHVFKSSDSTYYDNRYINIPLYPGSRIDIIVIQRNLGLTNNAPIILIKIFFGLGIDLNHGTSAKAASIGIFGTRVALKPSSLPPHDTSIASYPDF